MHINKQYEFANFGLRFTALLLDSIILIFIWIIFIKKLIGFAEYVLGNIFTKHFFITFYLYLIIAPIFLIAYRSFFESKLQGTPGKMILGIKVVNHNFNKISFEQAILRNVMKIFSSFLYIGYLIALGSEKCLTLHDMVAKTYVVREVKFIIINQK